MPRQWVMLQRITSVSICILEGSVLSIFFNPPPKPIFIKLTKMRFLPLIILQVLVLFILRAHAVERKPSQKPSSITHYVMLGKLIHFSVFSLSACKHCPDSYWRDNACKPLSVCLIDGQQMVVITLWINNEERRKSDTALLLENTLFTYNVYIQVGGITYMYQKMAFLTKIGEWGLETLGGGKHFWKKKKWSEKYFC